MSIGEYLEKIRNAVYGREVRESIAKGIETAYNDASEKHDNANMEVKLARGTHSNLNNRLKKMDEVDRETTTQLAQTDNLLNSKVGGGVLANMGDLSQDVKTTMTGGSVAVVGVESTSQINLTREAVTEQETSFINKSRNLFNPNNILKGYITNMYSAGVPTPSAPYSTSKEWVRVIPDSTLYASHESGLLFGDASKNPISDITFTTPSGTREVPENAYFVKINVLTQYLPLFQIEYSTETEYINGDYALNDTIKVSGGNIKGGSVDFKKLTGFTTSDNILNPRKIVEGHYVSINSGNLIPNTKNHSYLDLPILNGATHLRIQGNFSGLTSPAIFAFSNEVGYVSGKAVRPEDESWVVPIPKQAETVSISFINLNRDRVWVTFGVEEKERDEYFRYWDDYVDPNSVNNSTSPLVDKNIVFFGDSQTGMYHDNSMYPSVIAKKLKINEFNVGFSGTCLSNNTVSHYRDFSMVNLVDSIVSGDFSTQESHDESISDDLYKQRLNRLKGIDFNDVDIISMFYGANDYGRSTLLDDENDPFNKTTFNGAIRYVVREMLTKFPHLKIVLLTPLYRQHSVDIENSVGLIPSDYVDTIISNDSQTNLPYIDLWYTSGINEYNRGYYLEGDDLHISGYNGTDYVGNLIATRLENIW